MSEFKKSKSNENRLQRLKHGTIKDEEKSSQQEQVIIDAHQCYLNLVKLTKEQVNQTLKMLVEQPENLQTELYASLSEIQRLIVYSERQIDQIDRRVIKGEQIPHDEKVCPDFEEHTEWVNKGYA